MEPLKSLGNVNYVNYLKNDRWWTNDRWSTMIALEILIGGELC